MSFFDVLLVGEMIYGIGSVVLAFLVFFLAPTRLVNRFFFWAFLLGGLVSIYWGVESTFGPYRWFGDYSPTPAWIAAGTVAWFGQLTTVILYLAFVLFAAPVPWTRRLRSRHATWVVLALFFTVLAWLYFAHKSANLFHVATEEAFDNLPFFAGRGAWYVSIGLYSLAPLLAFDYWRRTKAGTAGRRQATSVLLAVIFRDIPLILIHPVGNYLTGLVCDYDQPTAECIAAVTTQHTIWAIFRAAFLITAFLGVVRGQLVDVDRKLHFTVSKATVASVFIVVFVGVQALVGEFVTSAISIPAGAAASAALFAVLRPLQNVAERFADKTVPLGRSKVDLSKKQREQFYREQVEIAYSDGSLGAKERKTLQNVRERLGLSATIALRIEDAVVA